MKTIKTGTKTVASLLICAQLLSACSDKGFESRINPSAANQETVELGTGDGGGGNAINYKMLESYMIDPNDLDVVKTRVKAIIERLGPDEEDDKGEYRPFDILKMKNWYLAPINLQVIPKDVLGIEFTKDGHQQVAIQTKDAIWIDSNHFSKMSPDEQAKLIVHEVMMMKYLFKFVSLEDLCYYSERAGGSCGDDQASRKITKNMMSQLDSMKPVPPRALNSRDYEIIRAMTAWVFENEKTLTYDSYTGAGIKIGFADMRFTSSYRNKNQDEVKLSPSQFRIAFKKAIYSGSIGTHCHLSGSETPVECLVAITKREKLEGYFLSPESELWDLKIIRKSDQVVLREELVVADHLSGFVTIDGGYQIMLSPYFNAEENKIGNHYFSVAVNVSLDSNKEVERVNGLLIQAVVVAHIENETDKTCRIHLAKSQKNDPQLVDLRVGVQQVMIINSFETVSLCAKN